MDIKLYLIPLIAAAIGWLTNWVAVKMLFHPKTPISFLGLFKLQGVFPKRREAFAQSLGQLVSNDLISTSEVAEHFKDIAVSDQNMDFVMSKISAVLTNKLPQAVPMLAMFINPELIASILNPLREELKQMVLELSENISTEVESAIDVHKIVADKVNSFSVDKLESMINQIMRKELREIEILGGVLGFFIGCSQLVITVM
jgi:uncharacterized membrane protein YheB (UPF0754 family)